MTDQLRIEIKDFRAIKDANIKMNGITVVTGVNGCGKSTLAKLVYNTLNVVVHYDQYIVGQLASSLSDVKYIVNVIETDLNYKEKLDWDLFFAIKPKDTILYFLQNRQSFIAEYLERIIREYYIKYKDTNNLWRLIRLIKVNFGIDLFEEVEDENFDELIIQLILKVDEYFSFYIQIVDSRKSDFVYEHLLLEMKNLGEIKKEISLNFFEYDVPILNVYDDNFFFSHSINDFFYIDSPLVIDSFPNTHQSHWEKLKNAISTTAITENIVYPQSINISKDITKGTADKSTTENSFIFTREDGLINHLFEVATGIKSFSILQLLLKNGLLTNKTLLIIDEPEAHLHPQWIVEYARVLVLLNKELGVKFLIASHSPDMVSAIRYISEKEETLDSLEYYLAEESAESRFQYNYKALGKDIDPIFKSFNIALDRINQYGVSNSDDLF